MKNTAPSKIYGDVRISADSFDAVVKEETAELVSTVLKTSSEAFASVEKFKFSQILLGDRNATSLYSKNISTLTVRSLFCFSYLL